MLWLLMEESCKCNGGSWLDCCDKHKVSPMGSWRFHKKCCGNLIVGFQTVSGLYMIMSVMMFFAADREMVAQATGKLNLLCEKQPCPLRPSLL